MTDPGVEPEVPLSVDAWQRLGRLGGPGPAAPRRSAAPPGRVTGLAPTLGPYVCDFIERSCVHGPGEVMGEPVRLNVDQEEFIYRLYELHGDGTRRYRRACYSRPKGSSKTELAAFVALVEALGPARCAGFDAAGKPVPTQAVQPDVMTTEECYSVIYYNLTQGPLAVTPGLDAGRTRIYLPGGGVIRAGSAGAASKDALPR